ncbi:MAG: ATP-binding cassette domain-containing protein, partial [Mycetocola sp.]
GFIAPSSFSFNLAVALIAGSIIGGTRSIYGAVVGAAIIQTIPLLSAGFSEWSLLVFGLLLLIGALLFKAGLAGTLNQLIDRLYRARGIPRNPRHAVESLRDDDLRDFDENVAPTRVTEVSKQFGGLKALDSVSITIEPGKVTALIGPNGSGKTTLLNMLSGFYPIDGGTITIGDRQLNGTSAHKIHSLGVSRTFQTPRIPEHLTVEEVVETGIWSSDPVNLLESVVRSPRARKTRTRHRAEARRALRRLQIEELADASATDLPLGRRRLVEVARAVVDLPRLLLLDEPASGLSVGETQQLSDALVELKQTPIATLLVEHNVDFVSRTADYVYVLDAGKLIAHGTPVEVMRDPAVIASYTGKAPE